MDRQAMPGPDVWVDARLAVRASPIAGRGLFATQPIAAGTVVLRLGGRLVTSIELDELIRAAEADPTLPYVDSIAAHDDRHLVLPPDTPAHFGNHSCDPTLWLVGTYEAATRRHVRAGEEATLDYGTFTGGDGFAMPCRCGSACCRGEVTADDWRRPDLRARYRGHWAPALQARIDTGGAD